LALLFHIAWNNRRDPLAGWFAAVLAALLVWATGYVLEILTVSQAGKILFANMQFVGIAPLSLCWWEMTRRYLGIRPLPKAVTALLWAIAVLTVLMAFVNPWHIFRGQPHIETSTAPFPVLHADYGPWYRLVFLPANFLLNLMVLAFLLKGIVQAHPIYRRQYVLLFLAGLIPLACAAIYVLALPPWRDYNL
ncbi:MAG: hypothetical protein H5T84_07780, partial [Thermoleophilia bacterium]|nr:hypothetical protein [Thermoleophilia bacterium]